MNRSRKGERLFKDDDEKNLFLEVVGDTVDRHAIEVHAYSLIPTQYHLLLRSPRRNLSRSMQYLGAAYTRRWNALRGRDGSVFRGRFSSQAIGDEAQLVTAFAYIHLNPLRAHLIRRIDSARAWTSHRAYLGFKGEPDWIRKDFFLDLIGGEEEVGKLVLAYHEGAREWPDDFSLDTGWFRSSTKASASATSIEDELHDKVLVSKLLGELCSITGVTRAALKRSRRGRVGNPARRFAVWALSRSTNLTQREIGDLLGMTAGHVARDMSRNRPRTAVFDQWVEQWSERFPNPIVVTEGRKKKKR